MPCSASSAIARCSSGSSASTALRLRLAGRRRFGLGRCGTSGGGVNDGPRRPRSPSWRRPSPRLAPVSTRSVAAPASTVAAVAAAATIAAGTTIVTVSTGSSVAIATAPAAALVAIALGAGLDHRLELALDRQQLDARRAAAFWRHCTIAQHGDAVDLLLDLDLELVADLGVGGQDRSVDAHLSAAALRRHARSRCRHRARW